MAFADESWLTSELTALRQSGLYRKRRTITPLPAGWCQVDGQRCRNFAGNDYLGLAFHPAVIEAAQSCVSQAGTGVTASALVTGRSHWHAELEQALAEEFEHPAALLFPSGYAANLGTIAALAGPEDVVFCERSNHACLVDGCRLSGATLRVFRIHELDRLAHWLEKARTARRRWIVADSLFSMDGTAAPLPQLCAIAEHAHADLIIDEAHAYGVLGEHGRGLAELQGVESRVAVRIGTLSKAMAGLGGFVTGSADLIDFLWNRARTQMFSTALPPAVCAAATAAIRVAHLETWRRKHVMQIALHLRNQLQEQGLETTPGIGPIVPVILHTPERTMSVAAQLQERGFVVGAIRPPTVPQGTSRLRITLSAAFSHSDVDDLLQALVGACR